MPEINDAEIWRIATQIERYLLGHPHAADTAEGIRNWWLPVYGIVASPAAVQQALDLLCAQAAVVCRAQPGGYTLYSSPQAQDE